MFDTLTLFLKQNHLQTSQALYALSDIQEHSKNDTGEVWHTGKQGNLRVKVQASGLSANGSLPKYYLGNNLESLTRKTTEQALEKMSDEFHLPMQEALVFRLDVGQNFIMQEPIASYLLQLGEARYYERLPMKKNGLLYTRYNGAISFYDKIADLKRHKEPIPEMYQGRNVLRYERRWTKRLTTQFKCLNISGSMLYDEKFYTLCLIKYEQDFFSIHKKQLPTNEVNMSGVKELYHSLLFKYLQENGEDHFLNMIKLEQAKGMKKHTAQDLRQAMRKAQSIKLNKLPLDNPILELETKVSQAVQYFR